MTKLDISFFRERISVTDKTSPNKSYQYQRTFFVSGYKNDFFMYLNIKENFSYRCGRKPIFWSNLFISVPFEVRTLRKLYFQLLSHLMGYDRGDNFPFDFESNGLPFGSKSKGKISPQSYPIQCERKWKYSFLSALAEWAK